MNNQGELSKSGPVVAVVGEDGAVRHSLKFWLEMEGLTVRSYASAAELLGAGDQRRCDCLVVDQKLPAAGFDTIAELRDRDFFAPAILITNHYLSLSLRENAKKAGIATVEKPLLGNGLLEAIREAVVNR
jgi:two-component system, LuxR family, response regulator FixJ